MTMFFILCFHHNFVFFGFILMTKLMMKGWWVVRNSSFHADMMTQVVGFKHMKLC